MKALVALFLLPFASAFERLEALGRVWAYARMQAALRTHVDRSVVVLGCPALPGTRQIELGRNLMLYPDITLETQAHGKIRIGDGVVISRGAHIVSFASIRIGAGAMIGEYASIRDANHRFGPGLSPRDSGHIANSIEIGANAWIGRGVAILAGTRIGEGAVVGANAVVTRDVPPNAVVGGVPARPLLRAVTQ